MKAAFVIGMILVALGVVVLVYFTSPVRILMQAYVPHAVDLRIPIAGGLSVACGAALLFLARTKKP
jgi:hypothetical protein